MKNGLVKKSGVVSTVTAGLLMMMPATQASARADWEEYSVDMLVTSVVPGEERTTPNEKWVFVEDKYVTTEGVGTVGTDEYSASLETTIRGKLSPDGTVGAEWGAFTLSLTGVSGDLACHGTFHVKRYVDERYPATSPVPYGEAGKFRAECDDGAKVMGDFVGEFGELNGNPGFVVALHGAAR